MTATLTPPAAPAPPPASMLEVVRAMDFDWALHLQRVWGDPPFDAAEIHTALRQRFANRLDDLAKQPTDSSPLGWVVVGSAGSGKTHWLSVCRQQAIARKMGFVLVDLTDVREFWQTVLQGYLDSLQQIYEGQKFQQHVLMERFLATLPLKNSVEATLNVLHEIKPDQLAKNVTQVIGEIHRRYPQHGKKFGDVIRALLATTSGDPDVSAAGLSWLNGNPVDEVSRKRLGFAAGQEQPRRIVQALSWLMSLCGPTVLAFDQLDPIVSYLNLARQPGNTEPTAEVMAAKAIFESLSAGFGAIRDVTFRTLTVIVGLDATWNALEKQTLSANLDRYESPQTMSHLQSAEAAKAVVWPRVAAACDRLSYKPPYGTWPFKPSVFDGLAGVSPRQLLKKCEQHRQACLASGSVAEVDSFDAGEKPPMVVPVSALAQLDAKFSQYRAEATPEALLEESKEDERLSPILIGACSAFIRELSLPETSDPCVDEFPGGKTTKPLHARIRIVNHAANDHEEHFCLRALQRTNASAFQTRLKAVLTGAGIDAKLHFRRVVILRTTQMAGGAISSDLKSKYDKEGGLWHNPSHDEVRSLAALKRLVAEKPAGLDEWLKERKPASALPIFQKLAPQLCGQGAKTAPPPIPIKHPTQPPIVPKPVVTSGGNGVAGKKAPEPTNPNTTVHQLAVGQRMTGTLSTPISMAMNLLEKHTVVLAGAGSGKTVLLKRIIEGAASCGIPSIVIDCANDLAALGDRWPEAAPEFPLIDKTAADAYHANTEVIVWTPNREAGNPLVFEPIPDLAAVADNAEDLQAAIEMVRESLAAVVAPGKSIAAQGKIGILSSALKFLAKASDSSSGTCSLHALIELLSDLPAEAGTGVQKQANLALQMADALRTQLEVNPLLRGSGTNFDPAVLFGDDAKSQKKTRISVISLVGLTTRDTQQHFLNQLAMTLFAWIKRNPTPPGRALRGLLVIDEAKDFVPSLKSTPCKESLQRLAAQARKYHLGVVFATQNPREIENTIIGNCSTQFYGKASSPAAQDVIKDQIQQRGGSVSDIGSLPKGTFYFCNADSETSKPVKIQIPMCLSHHTTLDPAAVVERAAKSRKRVTASP